MLSRKVFVGSVFLLFSVLYAQNITTAASYFKTVSEYYGSIKDFETDMNITMGRKKMVSKVSFKRPNLLRIDFSVPDTQVVLFDGDMLTIYLPESSAVLQQGVTSESRGMALATPEGLALMSRYYSIQYEEGQSAVALDDESDEQVIKLVLRRRNTTEAFSVIRLSINANTRLIRRIHATTPRGEVHVFNFTNYRLNQDIPDQRFIYDSPSSANVYNNFLLN
ncbi:MAG: outer membrane lipoprotein carrier protein LolA [Treponema sp.]|nr:outer membrane lipoprotein carrier protein LolA [Treponema sp.]